METKKLRIIICITSATAVIGMGLSIYAYFIEKFTMDNLVETIFAIVGLITIVVILVAYIMDKSQIQFDFNIVAQLADETLEEKIVLRDKTIGILKEGLVRKNLSEWELNVKNHLKKGKLQKAINSIDTIAGDEEAAQKHILKAKLYIANLQLTEAEKHYKQAVTIFPSYSNYFEIANMYYVLNHFSQAIEYYNLSLSLATSLKERADTLNNIGNVQYKYNALHEAEGSYKEALKIYRELADNDSNIFLPSVAMILINLSIFYQNDSSHKELSLKYAKETVEVLCKCNNHTPRVQLLLDKVEEVIDNWN